MNFVEVNGTALRYQMSGGGASTLVLIHEMGGTLKAGILVMPRFGAKRNVLRYDTRGAGLSQKVRGPLTIDTMADDLVSLMDALGIAGKVALAGVAVGGAIALHTAVRYPQRVAAVIASSPAVGIAADRRPALLAGSRKWSGRVCTPLSTRSTMAIRWSCAAIRSALRPFAPGGSAAIR